MLKFDVSVRPFIKTDIVFVLNSTDGPGVIYFASLMIEVFFYILYFIISWERAIT